MFKAYWYHGKKKKPKFAKIAFLKILSHKNCGWKGNSNNIFEFNTKKIHKTWLIVMWQKLCSPV